MPSPSKTDLKMLRTQGRQEGFTLVELLLALGLGAAVLVVGVMTFQNLTAGASSTGTYLRVTLDTAVVQNFYGLNQAAIDVWVAPNYGRKAHADLLRDQFWRDIERANAVFCLGRAAGVLNASHPETIALPANFQGQSLDLPEAFRQMLAVSLPASASTFTAYRGASPQPNASIFVLEPSDSASELAVRAVYDIDQVSTSSPAGTYVSVRRYQGSVLTDFYDVFYPAGAGEAFEPLVVAFERAARLAKAEGTEIDRLKVAGGHPFYFIWWPDPAMPQLEAPAGSFASTDPRASYPGMGGRTSLFFTVPMFPAL